MFSKMDGIFAGLPPRHVEKANARLEIRRDETDKDGKKKDPQSQHDYEAAEWDDTAHVSIASLRAFLESLIVPEGDIIPTPPPIHEASNTLNQRAASAYQAIGRAGHDQNVYAPAPPAPVTHASSGVEAHFSEEDIHRVRVFIGELAELSRQGVEELAMQKSASFLDSIEAAIATARL